MLVTNLCGQMVYRSIEQSMLEAEEAYIACGYVSSSGIELMRSSIISFLSDAHRVLKVVVGMALFEGITEGDLKALKELRCLMTPPSEVRFVWAAPYHGKVYYFRAGNRCRIYIGSSNLSSTGLARNIECNCLFSVEVGCSVEREVRNFLNLLMQDDFSLSFDSAERRLRIVRRVVQPEVVRAVGGEGGGSVSASSPATVVLHLSVHPRSGLNWCFGEGRPRDWYEVYVPVPSHIQKSGFFPPPGTVFNVVTDDGLQFQCKAAGTGGKNLESHPRLTILGRWIKGRLMADAGLQENEPVTEEHLQKYGRNFVTVIRLSDQDYYLDFSRPG